MVIYVVFDFFRFIGSIFNFIKLRDDFLLGDRILVLIIRVLCFSEKCLGLNKCGRC